MHKRTEKLARALRRGFLAGVLLSCFGVSATLAQTEGPVLPDRAPQTDSAQQTDSPAQPDSTTQPDSTMQPDSATQPDTGPESAAQPDSATQPDNTTLPDSATQTDSPAQSETQADGPTDEIGAVVSITGSGGAAKAFGARVSIDGANARVKAAGAVVDVRGQVEGPVWAAGAEVTVDASVGDSVRLAGARTALRGRAAGDVMVAGALVDIDATAGGDLKAAGANVRIGPLSNINGTLAAAGANVTFDGQVSGDAKLAGAFVTLNGRVDGDVSVHAERLVVGPRAVVAGGLLVRSLRAPEIDPAAQIAGDVVVEQPGDWFDNVPGPSAPIIAAAFALSIILVGLVFLIFARATYGEAVDHVRFRPLSTLLYGILSVVVLIVLAGLLMATVVGFALGVALLLLLPMILVLSQPVAAAGIVGWIFGRTVPRLDVVRLILFLILGALVIAFAGLIPFTGPWIVLATLIFGMTGVFRAVLWRFRTLRATDQAFGTGRREGVGT